MSLIGDWRCCTCGKQFKGADECPQCHVAGLLSQIDPSPSSSPTLSFARDLTNPDPILDEIENELAAQIATLIDMEVLGKILGWYLVYTSEPIEQARAWCESNCVARWKNGCEAFIFERKEDAALFVLFET